MYDFCNNPQKESDESPTDLNVWTNSLKMQFSFGSIQALGMGSMALF
jgi:hypothetical protein